MEREFGSEREQGCGWTGTIVMMTDTPKIRFVRPGSEQFAAAFQAFNRQPNGAVKAAVFVFLLVMAVPILLLLLVAGVLATAVFTVLYGFNRLIGFFRGLGGPKSDQGRRNVRVIDPRSGARRR